MSVHEDLEKARSRPDDLLAEIFRDHAEIKELFASVEAAQDRDERDRAFGLLMRKLVAHETAEQEILHPLTKRRDADPVAEAHLDQEKSAEKLLGKLESMGVDDDAFMSSLDELRRDVLAHAESEERDELPLLDERVEADELKKLASVFQAAERAAPTHPHPHGPTSAAGNAAVGPVVALADRVRDAVRLSRGDSADR